MSENKPGRQPRRHFPPRRRWDSDGWRHRRQPWSWDQRPPHWPADSKKQRGKFFLRFFFMFSVLVILVLGGMGAFAYLLSQWFGGGGRMAALVWVLGCGLSLALPLLAGGVGLAIYRGIATPIADVMSATDALAGGDLSARVPVPTRGPGEFRRLAKSFNHMAAELERLDRQRRNLTADVAHELRTPLHILQGNLEGILDGVYEPTSDQVSILLDEIHMLTRLVEDLQLLSTVESGQLTLRLEPVDIQELLSDVSTSFSGQMEAAGVALGVDVQGETGPIMMEADPERLDQVISNLVSNALRHTPQGGKVTLGARLNGDDIQIIVSDTGEGILADDLPFIFNRFWKGDRSRSRAGSTGSGLGLAIAQNLVQAHGGEISVESVLGTGTSFTIIFPGGNPLKEN